MSVLHSLVSLFAPLQAGGLFATPLGRLLVAIVALAIVVLVGRIVLHVAWRLLVIAGAVIGALYLVSLLIP